MARLLINYCVKSLSEIISGLEYLFSESSSTLEYPLYVY